MNGLWHLISLSHSSMNLFFSLVLRQNTNLKTSIHVQFFSLPTNLFSTRLFLSIWAPGGIWLSHHSSGWISVIPPSHHPLLCFSSRGEHILYLDTCDLIPHTCTLTHAQALSIYALARNFISFNIDIKRELKVALILVAL